MDGQLPANEPGIERWDVLEGEDDPVAAASRTMRSTVMGGAPERDMPGAAEVARADAEPRMMRALSGDPGDEQPEATVGGMVEFVSANVGGLEDELEVAPADQARDAGRYIYVDEPLPAHITAELEAQGFEVVFMSEEADRVAWEAAQDATLGSPPALRVLPGGAVDLAPRRKVQAWVDLRFQYESEQPYGAPDELEEEKLREIGALVQSFMELCVANGVAEGAELTSVVGHVLDKPGDPSVSA